MNLPNVLTVSRIFFTIIFAMFTQLPGVWGAGMALAFFAIAALTDLADGYFARKYDLITSFGKIMDPIADKLLTLTAFFIFAFEGRLALWMVVLVAGREILVTVLRIYALTIGKLLPAESSGKIKAACQMITVSLVLLYRLGAAAGQTRVFVNNYQFSLLFLINGIMMMTVVLTLWSGLCFFRNLNGRR